jgi:SAM-dependent methyltransferase
MYSSFAHEFSKTRTRPWPCVDAFLSKLPSRDGASSAKLLDVGCGNGRNLAAAAEAGFIAEGFDVCPEFVDICRSRGLTATVENIDSSTNPIHGTYDAIMCIAVLHHLRTESARQLALNHMYEALNPGGELLVTVWSFESIGARFPKQFVLGDNNVPWKSSSSDKHADRYYYIYDKPSLDTFLETFRATHPFAHIHVSWEEQNWVIHIRKH